jgi:hypothetical protein
MTLFEKQRTHGNRTLTKPVERLLIVTDTRRFTTLLQPLHVCVVGFMANAPRRVAESPVPHGAAFSHG